MYAGRIGDGIVLEEIDIVAGRDRNEIACACVCACVRVPASAGVAALPSRAKLFRVIKCVAMLSKRLHLFLGLLYPIRALWRPGG